MISGGGSLYERFISQRRLVIKVLMEDIINATEQRLGKLRGIADVRKAPEYTVNHSPKMQKAVAEVWHKLQAGRLHKDARVIMANVRSANIVSQLVILLCYHPDLISVQFRLAHERLYKTDYLKFYRDRVGRHVRIPEQLRGFLSLEYTIGQSGIAADVTTENLILAKDYVASLTDSAARSLHSRYALGR